MADRFSPLLQDTVQALSMLDAEKLEQLCAEAEALVANHREEAVQGAIEARALKRTLLELLQTTDANLRMLRELRMRGLRSNVDESLSGGGRWER